MRIGSWQPAGFLGAIALVPLLSLTAAHPQSSEKPSDDDPPPRTDRYGDPLPEGARMRVGSVKYRPGGAVNSVAFSPDGETIVSGTEKGFLHIWQARTGIEVGRIAAHEQPVTSVAFSPDGKTIASGSEDGTIRFRDAVTGRETRKFEGHAGAVRRIALSPDGKRLASAGIDGTARIWDAATGKETLRFDAGEAEVRSVAFSSDGRSLAWVTDGGEARISDATSGREILRLEGDEEGVMAVAFTPDGKGIAYGGGEGPIRVRDLQSGEVWPTLTTEDAWVEYIVFSPDGGRLVSGSDWARVDLWDVESQLVTMSLTSAGYMVIHDVAFSPKGDRIALGQENGTVVLLDAETGEESLRCNFKRSAVRAVAYSPDGRWLASAGNEPAIHIWDPSAGKEVRRLLGHQEPIVSIAFSADGKMLASESEDGTIRIWSVDSGKERFRVRTGDRTAFPFWGGEDRGGVSFSPDCKGIYLWQDGGLVTRWDLGGEGPSMSWSTCPTPRGRMIAESPALPGGAPPPNAMAVSRDGRTLVFRGGVLCPSAVLIVDAVAGEQIETLMGHKGIVHAVAISPDGSTLATAGTDKWILLWEMDTAQSIARMSGHTSDITSLAFSPDGSRLASGSRDGTVRLWDPAAGRAVGVLEGHRGEVRSVSFSADGKTIASGGKDTTLLLWDPPGVRQDARRPKEEGPGPDLLESRWLLLPERDAAAAHEAIRELVAHPEESVPFLREKLLQFPEPVRERVWALIEDLDSDDFSVRERADRRLAGLGDRIGDALVETLEKDLSPEVRVRIQGLLQKIGPIVRTYPSIRLQRLRAIRALEWIGTEEAAEVLGILLRDSPSVRERTRARVALEKISARQGAKTP